MVPTNCSSSSLKFHIHIIIVYTDLMYLFDLVGIQKSKTFQCALFRYSVSFETDVWLYIFNISGKYSLGGLFQQTVVTL